MTSVKAITKKYLKEIKYINLQFTDLVGTLRTVTVANKYLGEDDNIAVAVDGSSIDGFSTIEESDLILSPIKETFSILPWNRLVGRMLCELKKPSGKNFEGDPRFALRQFLEKIAEKFSFSFFVGSELEFFLIKDKRPLDNANYYSSESLDYYSSFRFEMASLLEHFKLHPEFLHHEVAPGQHEINFRYNGAIQTADGVQTYKYIAKQLAHQSGFTATFMPKPFSEYNGSGMHVHMSLTEKKTGKNIFAENNNLSQSALNFIGGLLKYAQDISLITSPTVNSYKRLIPGQEAPVHIAWGFGNRSALIRVPNYSLNKKESIRVEYRSPDPLSNPYLVFLCLLAAGIKGIKEKLEPAEPITENLYKLSKREREKMGILSLPTSLDEAIENFKNSSFIREVLGKHIYQAFIQIKTKEWEEYIEKEKYPYRNSITHWEWEKYINL